MSEDGGRPGRQPARALLTSLESGRFLLLGMVHLRALPGSPGWRGNLDEVTGAALADARALAAAGFDGVLVENFGDAPFVAERLAPETVAALAVVAAAVRRELPHRLLGVNALRNDAAAALGVALAAGAELLRVNVHTGAAWSDQGLLTGRAADTLRRRAALGAPVAIVADVLVKHARPAGESDPARLAREAVERGLADALVVSGPATGAQADLERLAAVAAAVPDTPVLVGSGVNPETLSALATAGARGAIVGTCLKHGGRIDQPVDPERARRLADARDRL